MPQNWWWSFCGIRSNCCLLHFREVGHINPQAIRKNGRAIQTTAGYGLPFATISSDHSTNKDGRVVLIIYCCGINYSNTKWFKTVINTAVVLMGWLGSARRFSLRVLHVISRQIVNGTGDTWLMYWDTWCTDWSGHPRRLFSLHVWCFS